MSNGDEAKPLSDGGEAQQSLPPSLSVSPNIPWEHQTLEQLSQERDYWIEQVATAPGFVSAKAADDFRKACEAWIEKKTPSSDESNEGASQNDQP
jgi:hypothetical protein